MEPIVLDLKKTKYGYQLIAPKANTTISLSKSMLTKTGKKTADSKGSVTKSNVKKSQTSVPGTAQKEADLSRSKTSVKPSPGGSKNVPTGQAAPKEKVQHVVAEVEVKRREIFPFTDFTMNVEESESQQEKNITTDINIAADPSKADKSTENMAEQPANISKPEKAKKKYPLVIPSSSHWFQFNEIHAIEKEEVPEFFQGKPSKSPEVYKKYRNYIVNLYRQNPKLYLNSTRCRKNLGGDACAIMRVHEFLERWGLINYSVNPKNLHQAYLARADRTTEKFGIAKYEDKVDMFDEERKMTTKSHENDGLFSQIKVLTKKQRPLCHFCGQICGLVWYQQKPPQQYEIQVPTENHQNGPLAPVENLPENQPAPVEAASVQNEVQEQQEQKENPQEPQEKMQEEHPQAEKPEQPEESENPEQPENQEQQEQKEQKEQQEQKEQEQKGQEEQQQQQQQLEEEKPEQQGKSEKPEQLEQHEQQEQHEHHEEEKEDKEDKEDVDRPPRLRRKVKELELCIKCFTEGHIPNILSHADFNKLDIISKLNTDLDSEHTADWTEEEDSKLIDLIQKHGDDWEEIEKELPGRSPQEIILHYLQFPLENVSSITITEAQKVIEDQQDTVKKTQDTTVPTFSEYSNPILQHVAIFRSLLEKYRKKYSPEAKDEVKTEQQEQGPKGTPAKHGNKDVMEIEENKPAKLSGKASVASKESEGKKSQKRESPTKKRDTKAENGDLELNLTKMELETADNDSEKLEAMIKTLCHFDEQHVEMLGHWEDETKQRADKLMVREEDRIRLVVNWMVDLQINKLETKLSFLEEYERILIHERRNQEIVQKMMIAERVMLAHKELELLRQGGDHNMHLYENRDPTAMLNLNMNVDDMISLNHNDKIDEYTKDSF